MLLRRFFSLSVNWKESVGQEDLDTQYYTTYNEKCPISTNPSTVKIPGWSHIYTASVISHTKRLPLKALSLI
jgi:hypothetical protein